MYMFSGRYGFDIYTDASLADEYYQQYYNQSDVENSKVG
jgi:hypothetical protein